MEDELDNQKDVLHVDNAAFHGSTNFYTTFSKLLGFFLTAFYTIENIKMDNS